LDVAERFSIKLIEMPNMIYSRYCHSNIIIHNRYLITISVFENKKCKYFDFSTNNKEKNLRCFPDLNIWRMELSLFFVNDAYLYCFGGTSTNININNPSHNSNLNNTKDNLNFN